MSGTIKKLIYICLLFFSSNVLYAGGFFETGTVTLDDTVDGGVWEEVTFNKTFVNPVVVAGPLTDNNTHSLFPRIRI